MRDYDNNNILRTDRTMTPREIEIANANLNSLERRRSMSSSTFDAVELVLYGGGLLIILIAVVASLF